jgi:hypothetical protein
LFHCFILLSRDVYPENTVPPPTADVIKETKCEKGNKKKGENLEEKGITRDIKRKYKFKGYKCQRGKNKWKKGA